MLVNVRMRLLMAVLAAVCVQIHVGAAQQDGGTDERLLKNMEAMSRHLMEQQFYFEEQNRYDGDSGIKQIRQRRTQKDPTLSNSYSGTGYMNIHDHADTKDTVGLGEFSAVLNGFEFMTRHNDYKLVQPSRNNTAFDVVDSIEFPEVPQSVLKKTTVDGQMEEMRKYFEAWAAQDSSIRNYRNYFPALLCYLEGAWTDASILEPFDSDRHFIDASSFEDLFNKVQFSAYSGRQHIDENFAFLPRRVMGWNDTSPIFGQWNYRILCHQLNDDLPLDRFELVNDLSQVMKSKENIKYTRNARFRLDGDKLKDNLDTNTRLVDKLMSQIPGKENYGGQLNDTIMSQNITDIDGNLANVAYYHRQYWTEDNGLKFRRRGFSDQNLFMAMTEQQHVIEQTINIDDQNVSQRWSYAIPLEILYMTPLSKWNPYNLTHHSGNENKKIPVKGGRNGENTPELAFNGTSKKYFFRTPDEFFSGPEVGAAAADTSGGTVHVLDPQGEVRAVRASGHRVLLPMIEGAGILRQRYPIAPLNDEGNSVYKELAALKKMVYQLRKDSCKGKNGNKILLEGMGNNQTYTLDLPRHQDKKLRCYGWRVKKWIKEIKKPLWIRPYMRGTELLVEAECADCFGVKASIIDG